MGRVQFFLICTLLTGCSSVGPGFENHPVDCALGIEWADCLPGTAGYNNGGGQLYKEREAQAQQQKNTDRMQKATAEFRVCLQKRKDHVFKTYAESSACANDALERGFREAGYPWMDLILSLDAKRSQLASEVDKKIITEEDMNAGLAEKYSEITSEELHRKAQLASVTAQQDQAIATQHAALAQTLSALPQSQSTHCTTNVIGSQLNTNCY